jgi:hypothetical protein
VISGTLALVVTGDKHGSPHLTVAGSAWHAEPYVLSPSPKSPVTLLDAEHGMDTNLSPRL